MEHGIQFIQDLGIILIVALIVGWACQRIGLSVIVGFLAAGMLVGPHSPAVPLVHDAARIDTLAQVGLVFLMFSIGLHLSLRRLRRLGLSLLVATFAGAQVLFVQHLMQILAPGGRCGVVLDEGFLYRTNEEAFVRTKRKLLDENEVWCIVSLPGGAFTGAGAGVKTNLVFFTRGRRTERIWFYDLSQIKVGKKSPLTLRHFEPVFGLLAQRGSKEAESALSWTLDFADRKRVATAAAAPHRREADAQRERAASLREQIKAIPRLDRGAQAGVLLADAVAADRLARDALAKVQGIEDAVYDLKAVNPAAVKLQDERTPAQLLQAITAKGREVDEALAALQALLEPG